MAGAVAGGPGGGVLGNPNGPGHGGGGFGTPGHGGVRNPGGIPWLNRFDNHPVRFLQNHPGKVGVVQQMLRGSGYHINIDGSLGPQTIAAAHAYHNGIGAQHWNTHNPHSNSFQVTQTDRTAAHGGGGGGHSGSSMNPHGARHGFGSTASHTPRLPKAALGGGFQTINPMRYARLQTRMQYGPILQQLAAQLAQQQAQGGQNMADLTHWFDQAKAQAGQATAADQAAAHQAQQGADQFRLGVLGAIGGGASPGAGAVGAYSGITSAGQQQLAENQGSYDAARQALTVSQAASSQLQQQRMDANKLAAIQAAQQQALGQRASALALNMQNARQLYDQELAARQAMALSGYNAQTQRQITGRQLTQMDLQNQGLAKSLRQNGVNTGRGPAILRDPKQSLALHNTIESQLFAPLSSGTGKAFDPKEAWVQMRTVLKAATGKSDLQNRAVFNWMRTQYRAYVGQYVSYYNKQNPDHPVNVDQFLTDSGTPNNRNWWHAHGVTWV